MDKKFRVRFRIDGVLQEMQSPPKRLQSAIISRLKIMTGSMSIAEKRLPQDGRIQVRIKKKPIDLRISTIPTNHGESMVLRILDKSSLKLGLPELGFFSDDQETFERLMRLADGIVLVTGPTGSGKTTTLYACLHYINKPDRKIITVEEPIEYQMTGINQVQVNTEIGCVAFDTSPGTEHHYDRGDPRSRDGEHRNERESHRPSCFQYAAHQ
jgi:general secretion pathway protein E/type IV pilus assembly protein PilB